jgi:hypothetical protein
MEYSFTPRRILPPSPPSQPESVNVVPRNSSDPTTHSSKSIESAKLELTYRNGPLLESIEVFTVFLGKDWHKEPNVKLAQDINEFFNFIVSSALIDQLKEYSVENQQIEYGRFIGSVTVDPPNSHSTMTDDEIRILIQKEIMHKTIPSPTENTVYFIYLSPGITVIYRDGKSCQTFCAYHENIIEKRIFYTVIAYPDCPDCQGGLNIFDALTVLSSHKISDLITNKVSGKGWYHNEHGDIGDVCLWQTKKLGKFTIQKEWSNLSKSCM